MPLPAAAAHAAATTYRETVESFSNACALTIAHEIESADNALWLSPHRDDLAEQIAAMLNVSRPLSKMLADETVLTVSEDARQDLLMLLGLLKAAAVVPAGTTFMALCDAAQSEAAAFAGTDR